MRKKTNIQRKIMGMPEEGKTGKAESGGRTHRRAERWV
jgi:hypothetical protein